METTSIRTSRSLKARYSICEIHERRWRNRGPGAWLDVSRYCNSRKYTRLRVYIAYLLRGTLKVHADKNLQRENLPMRVKRCERATRKGRVARGKQSSRMKEFHKITFLVTRDEGEEKTRKCSSLKRDTERNSANNIRDDVSMQARERERERERIVTKRAERKGIRKFAGHAKDDPRIREGKIKSRRDQSAIEL